MSEAKRGKDEAEQDLKSKPEGYDKGKPEREAEERKHGGEVKKHHRHERKRGGKAEHKEEHKEEHERHERKLGGPVHHIAKKHVGHVKGEEAPHHAGRKPRKSGGRAACEASPFTSAHKGHNPKGRRTDGDLH